MWRYPNGAGWVDSSQLSSPVIAQVVQISYFKRCWILLQTRDARVTIFYSVSTELSRCPWNMINSATVHSSLFFGGSEALPDVVPWSLVSG